MSTITDNFHRANGAVGNGWTAGGSSPSATINGHALKFSTGGYNSPAADFLSYGTTPGRDSEVLYDVSASTTANDQTYALFRYTTSANGPTFYGGTANLGQNRLDLFKVVNGARTFLQNIAFQHNSVAGNAVRPDVKCYGVNPTLFDATVTDTITGVVLYSGTGIVGEASSSITTSNGLSGVGVNWEGVSAAESVTIADATINPLVFSLTDFYPDPAAAPTSTTVKLTGLAAGGTAPYAWSLQRSTTGTFPGTAVTSGTGVTLGYTDAGLTPGTKYYYQWTITDSSPTPQVVVGVSYCQTPNAPIALGFAGDSITANGQVTGAFPAALAAICPFQPVTVVNQGVAGTTSGQWATDNNGILTAAVNAFKAAGVTDVLVMLGTNDAKTPPVATSAYAANMAAVCAAFNSNGMTVYLNEPVSPAYAPTPAALNQWDATSLVAVQAYSPALDALVNGTTIRKGDRAGHAYCANSAGVLNWTFDGIHLAAVGGPAVAYFWASAYAASKGLAGAGSSTAATKLLTRGGIRNGGEL